MHANTAIVWKTGHAKGVHIQEGEGKSRKLRSWIWLMYSVYKNEYRTFKPFETTRERDYDRKK
jgi:hypothetical protein